MPVVEPKDPLDKDLRGFSIRLGKLLRKELDRISDKNELSLLEVFSQILKKGLREDWHIEPPDPLDRDPDYASMRIGAELKARLKEKARKNGLKLAELITQWLKLGVSKDRE